MSNYNNAVCPKCDRESRSTEECEHCGALISKILERQTDVVSNDSGKYYNPYSAMEKPRRSLTGIVMLIIVLAAGGVMAFYGLKDSKLFREAPETDGFVFSTFTSSFKDDVLKYDTAPVLVDFYADWCGPCKMMKPEIEQFAKDNSQTIKVVKVNIDNNPDLAKQYKIHGIPALVLFKNGAEVQRETGYRSAEDLKTALKDHLS